MENSYNLIVVKITKKEDNMVDLEFYTADGKQQIVSLSVHESALPPMQLGAELTSDEHTALLQLLFTPYGHLNLLERWLNWACNRVENSSGVIIGSEENETKKPKIAVEGLIKDTKRLLGILDE